MDDEKERLKVLQEINVLSKYLASVDRNHGHNERYSYVSQQTRVSSPKPQFTSSTYWQRQPIATSAKAFTTNKWSAKSNDSHSFITSGNKSRNFAPKSRTWSPSVANSTSHIKTTNNDNNFKTSKQQTISTKNAVKSENKPLIITQKSISKSWKPNQTSWSAVAPVHNIFNKSPHLQKTETPSTTKLQNSSFISQAIGTHGSTRMSPNKNMVWTMNTKELPSKATILPNKLVGKSAIGHKLSTPSHSKRFNYSYSKPFNANYGISNRWQKSKKKKSGYHGYTGLHTTISGKHELHHPFIKRSQTWNKSVNHSVKGKHLTQSFHPTSTKSIKHLPFSARRKNYLHNSPALTGSNTSSTTRKSVHKSAVFSKLNNEPKKVPRKNSIDRKSPFLSRQISNSKKVIVPKAKFLVANHLIKRSLFRAKQKSFRNSDHCIFYNKFGRCKDGDNCKYIHDPTRVAVCTQFLRGTCRNVDGSCPFVHRVDPNKMPVCVFFLRGLCHKDDCPYAHVNVNKNAGVCQEFLKGFCPNGVKCKYKHTVECEEYKSTGKCSSGKKCHLIHRDRKRRRRSSSSTVQLPKAFNDVVTKRKRKLSHSKESSKTQDKGSLQIKPSFISSKIQLERITFERLKTDSQQNSEIDDDDFIPLGD